MPLAFESEGAWGQCLTYFLASCHSPATRRTYQVVLKQFFTGEVMPDMVSKQDVLAFLHRPRSERESIIGPRKMPRPASASLYNLRLAVLRKFYAFAREYTVTGEGGAPAPLMTRPSPCAGIAYRETPRRYRYMSEEEVVRFFAAIPGDTLEGLRDRAIFLFYFWSARRRSEIARLVWGDIEASSAVPSGYIYHFVGKGRPEVRDSAELPAPVYRALIKYLEASGRMAHMCPDSPLFVRVHPISNYPLRYHNRPLHGTTINLLMKQYARKAGLDDSRITLHSFRHTAARERHAAGADVLDVMRLLRHTSLRHTYEYLFLLSGEADSTLPLIAEKFSGLEGGE
jgi:integrase